MLTRSTKWLTLIVAGGLALPLSAQEKSAPDWPVFRGDSLQTGVARCSLPETLAVRWTFNAQTAIESSPVISGQTVFVGTSNGKLYALDLTSGKKKWEQPIGGILAVPAVRDGAVYLGDVKGQFHCFDAATGKKRWSVTTDGEIRSSANFAQDKIVFGSNDCNLYCVDKSGKILWQFETEEKVQGTPAVSGDRIFIASCDKHLHVIDLLKGHEVASIPLGGQVGASASVRGDHLYVGNMVNQFLAVEWKKGVILWKYEAKRAGQPFFSSAAVTDELVVAGSRDKKVRAWQRQTGKEVWTFAAKGRVDSSPVIAGQRVIVGSMDHHLYVLDLARGTQISSFELGPMPGSPAVGEQCVVVATVHGEVVCLGAKR